MKRSTGRLNPFVLPSETNVRFRLLAVTSIALSVHASFVLADQFGLPSLADLNARIAASSHQPVGGDVEAYRRYLLENIVALRYLLAVVSVPAVLVGLTLGLTWLLYRTHHLRVRPRGALAVLPDVDQSLLPALRDLAAAAAVPMPQRVEIEETARASTLRVFGFPGRYIIRIASGWLRVQRHQPGTFRALLLHEYAHIANQDVRPAYLARALWPALGLVGIVPLITAITVRWVGGIVSDVQRAGFGGVNWLGLATSGLPRLLLIYVQVGVILAVVAQVYASILRVRELYADARVALWGAGEPLEALIARQMDESRDDRRRFRLRYHPGARVRLEVLRDPTCLFQIARDLPFFVGVLFAVLIQNLSMLVSLLVITLMTVTQVWMAGALSDVAAVSLLGRTAGLALPLLLIVLVVGLTGLLVGAGYLVTETLGLEVQRSALGDLGADRPGGRYLRLLGAAGLTALGIQVGTLFSFYNPTLGSGSRSLLLVPLWMISLTGLIWLWMISAYASAGAVLGTYQGRMPPTRRRRLLGVALFCLACVTLVPSLLSQQVLVPLLVGVGAPSSTLLRSLVLPAAGALVVYGFAAAITWTVTAGLRRWRSARCAACAARIGQRRMVGQQCVECGRDLTPWLLQQPGPRLLVDSLNLQASAASLSSLTDSPSGRRVWYPRALVTLGIGVLPLLVLGILFVLWRGVDDSLALALLDSQVVGRYEVQGTTWQGGTYSGNLSIVQVGPTYRLVWDTTDGSFTGTAVRTGSTLAVVYGLEQMCRVVSYRVLPDGALDGQWLVHGQQQVANERAIPAGERTPGRVSGSYAVAAPEQPTYSGTLVIHEAAETARLSWQTAGRSFTGTGLRHEETLAAVSGGQACGLVLYQIEADGRLSGRWTIDRETQAGREQAQRIRD